jgi:hypothetical protein
VRNPEQQTENKTIEHMETNKIELPTAPRKATRDVPSSLGIVGKHKSGKTTAIAELPNCLIIETEESGADFVDATVLPMPTNIGPVSKFKWLKEVAAKIKEENYPYDFVAIDTFTEIDMAAEWYGTWIFMNSILGKEFNRQKNNDGTLVIKDGKTVMLAPSSPDYLSVATLPNGAGWNYIRNASLDMFEELKNLGKVCTIFVFHLADKYIGEKNTEAVATKEIAVTGKLKDIISRKLDGMGTVWNEDGDIMISFVDKNEKLGGIRGEHLPGYTGKLDWNFIFKLDKKKSDKK